MADYDVIVIGAGPGGYVCAIRCAQLGLKTACVEGRETLGGTCLNIGCIPSKALLHASELYHEARARLREDGPDGRQAPKIDWPEMQAYKQIDGRRQHQGHRVPVQEEQGRLAEGLGQRSPRPARSRSATPPTRRSRSSSPPAPSRRRSRASRSTRRSSSPPPARSRSPAIPKRLAVIGAGVIGLELGSVYARLGSEVTVIEFLDQITPGVDLEVVQDLPEAAGQAGPDLHPRRRRAGRDPGRGRRHRRLQAPQGRQRRLARGRRGAGLHRPPPLHRRPRPRGARRRR